MPRALLAVIVAALAAGPAAAAPGFVHRFSFSQVGTPWEVPAGVRSTTSGHGSVVVGEPLRPGPLGLETQRASIRGSVTIEHAEAVGGRTLRLRLRAVSAELTAFADGSRFLALVVRVIQSNDPACPAGRVGDLYLLDGVSSRDAVRLYLCPPDQERFYETTQGHGVATVTIA